LAPKPTLLGHALVGGQARQESHTGERMQPLPRLDAPAIRRSPRLCTGTAGSYRVRVHARGSRCSQGVQLTHHGSVSGSIVVGFGWGWGCGGCFCLVFPGLAGFLGVWGWICVLVWGRVLFFESPPLKRMDCGQTPFDERPGNGARFCVWFWVGALLVELKVAETLICEVLRVRVSLKSCSGASRGPGFGLWWCRVCLLFENSIVCQVC
jgi:hypothetical protein